MNYWNKKTGPGLKSSSDKFSGKKRNNFNQSSPFVLKNTQKAKKIKKSLQYLLVLKKFNNIIDYKNIALLRAFLTKFGKIRSRRKTRVTVQQQHRISKAIRKARNLKLIPFIYDVLI